MDVVELGVTEHGVRVYLDQHAAQADAIIAVNRIKAHTNFRGSVESGLAKMLAIGAGKHAQALAIHAYGVDGLKIHMPQVAQAVLDRAPVIAGIGLLEDGQHQLSEVHVLAADNLLADEAKLLAHGKQWLPTLPVDNLDLLIVDQIGKDISGTGMDTNVTGRCRLLDFNAFPSPNIAVVIAGGLSKATKGNAIGMGAADIICRRLADAIIPEKTNINALTGQCPQLAARPMVAGSDQEALQWALNYLGGPNDIADRRIIRIHDTLHLNRLEVSAALWQEIEDTEIAAGTSRWLDDGHNQTFTADGAYSNYGAVCS